jgi:aromatic ring-opening dioxygenase LigB subunit
MARFVIPFLPLYSSSVSGILNLDMPDLPDAAEQLHVSSKYLGDYVADHRADIILLVSHRGVCLTDSLAIVTGATVSGTAEFNKHWGDFEVSANLADDVARDLAEVLEKRRVDNCLMNMEGLGGTESDGKLGWGEVLLLYCFDQC